MDLQFTGFSSNADILNDRVNVSAVFQNEDQTSQIAVTFSGKSDVNASANVRDLLKGATSTIDKFIKDPASLRVVTIDPATGLPI